MVAVSVNVPAPDFELVDLSGQPVKLSSFLDRRHVLLVFNRGFI